MLAIQMGRRSEGNEELTAVGARAAVGHTQRPLPCMLQAGVELVFEFSAVDGGAAAASAGGIAALDHEAWDYAVEDYGVVLPSRGEGRKVFAGLVEG